MTYNAIPTTIAGVRFRSRLEARWSIFFDLVGWTWHYEPLDLEGYIPDFIVEHPTTDWLAAPAAPGVSPGTRRLVEVKPAIDPLLLTEHVGKIEESGWTGPAAIVGSTLWDSNPVQHGAEIGVQSIVGDASSGWGPWVMVPRARALLAWREAGNLTQWKGPRAAAGK
jgi:hypothetical protein